MAALQSRARTQHHLQQDTSEDASIQQSSAGDARHSRHPHRQQHLGNSGNAAERAGGLTGEDEAWILFAPPQPASLDDQLRNRTIAEQEHEDTAQQDDPFQQPEGHDSILLSSSTSDWQHVSPSSSPHSRPDTEQHDHPDAAVATPRSPPPRAVTHYASSGQLSNPADTDNNNHSRWSAVPIPRRDTSSFFDDDVDDEEDDDELFSDDKLLSNTTDRQKDSGERSAFLDENSQSIYPEIDTAATRRQVNKHSIKLSQDAAEDTDMLSLPSSLSVSDRSTSDDLPSPRFDYPDSAFQLTRGEGEQVSVKEEEIAGNSNITLTEAALSRIARGSTPASPNKEAEAALTSGSEDEADHHHDDEEEAAISRAPDAISAGIRPTRRKALQSIRAPSQLSDAISGGRVSSSQKSATKRRHRQSGISDKGSKRSNTSASRLIAQETRLPLSSSSSRSRDRSGEQQQGAQRERHAAGSPTRGRTARFAQAAREMFSVDEEVMNMMAQSGSAFSQPLPLHYRQRRAQDRSPHGFSAFSAHMASELGDCPAVHSMFTALYDDDQTIDSGDETETEPMTPTHQQHRTRRNRRRSSFFADNGSVTQSQSHLHASSTLTPDQLHTASLGLHRSFTFASFQHFLIGSVYNSLSSSMLGSTTTARSSLSPNLSASVSAYQQQQQQAPLSSSSNTFISSRKRTTSAPSVDRSHSSSDLYGHMGAAEEQQGDPLEYKEAMSYWRRVFKSLAF